MKKLIDIIKSTKVLHNLDPNDVDEFPGGGGGSGDGTTPQGGTGGGTSGTTSGIVVPTLSISPSGDQSMALGTSRCFTASGSIIIPQESERFAIINSGCSLSSNGTWEKSLGCGTNNNPDAECHNTSLIYNKQPFHIVGTNGSFVGSTPGVPINNSHTYIGVKSVGGYYFYWEVLKYCNATAGSCNSNWLAYVKVNFPDGTIQTLSGGLVEFNQQFRVKSDGTRIIWEYTTYNNWVYSYFSLPIPANTGDFQFFVNALWIGNKWNNLKTYRGSFQGTVNPDEFIWNSDCINNLDIDGNTACFTPTVPGSCDICVSTTTTDPICVTVVSSPLYLHPVDQDCNNCADSVDCLNIPDPSTPVIILDSILYDTINLNWPDSISYTTGLYYEVRKNGVIEKVLDNNITYSSLPDGFYEFEVRAVDDCGMSPWSNTEVISVSSLFVPPAAPTDFAVSFHGGEYYADWTASVGAVLYEIWAGDPQTTFLLSSVTAPVPMGLLLPGLSLSVRAQDGSGDYSDFSNIEVVI